MVSERIWMDENEEEFITVGFNFIGNDTVTDYEIGFAIEFFIFLLLLLTS